MSENFEKLIIGSDYEGAEGMFEQSEESSESTSEETQKARQERGIFPDAQERFNATLEDLELQQERILENGAKYPSLDQWIDHRITHERGTKFFPAFLKNKDGEKFFCKLQISENPQALEGLKNEAERLQATPDGINRPKLVKYVEPKNNRSAMLITELIPIREATVIPAEDWSEQHVADAARQIKIMENYPQESKENPNFTADATRLLEGAGDTVLEELRSKIKTVIANYAPESRATYVHGDAGLKNILADKDGTVHFVDWEFKGEGFKGQDAAKLWSGLQKNPVASRAFLEEYTHDPDGTIDEGRKNAIIFGVMIENLVHLKWRNENIIQTGKLAEHPNVQQQIEELNLRMVEILT